MPRSDKDTGVTLVCLWWQILCTGITIRIRQTICDTDLVHRDQDTQLGHP